MTRFMEGPVGGYGGGDPVNFLPPNTGGPWKISEIVGREGNAIDSIGVDFKNSQGDAPPRRINLDGGGGGTSFKFDIPNNDYLTRIWGCTGGWVNRETVIRALQFVTKNGKVSSVYGESAGLGWNLQCPDGYQIVGIQIRAGDLVDSLGVYIDTIP